VVDRHPDDDLLIFPVASIPLQASQPGSVNSVNSGNRYGRINQTDGDRSTGVERTATDSSINAAPSASATQENDDDLINSDLDSDDDEEPNIETSNRILCQFEKVTRTRNRWKCVLRDGVAKINGRDFVFQKAQGDFEF
jgi:transcription initiation factor TFIIA large subunit